MTNEQIVSEIRNGFSTTNNMQLLYESNLPLIKKFIKPYTAYECEADLLQESYFGLLEAVKRYETDRNVQFMTFAQYWIKQSVQRYLENCGSTVRIPTHTRTKMSRIRKATSQLRQERGREPVPTEIAALLGVSVEEVQEIQGYMQSVISLDTPIAEDNSLTLADTLQADLSLENDTVDKIYSEHSKNELWGIVERYTTTRENDIIKEIFLHGKTMSAVAREQGVTIERVRQTKEKGLRRLHALSEGLPQPEAPRQWTLWRFSSLRLQSVYERRQSGLYLALHQLQGVDEAALAGHPRQGDAGAEQPRRPQRENPRPEERRQSGADKGAPGSAGGGGQAAGRVGEAGGVGLRGQGEGRHAGGTVCPADEPLRGRTPGQAGTADAAHRPAGGHAGGRAGHRRMAGRHPRLCPA